MLRDDPFFIEHFLVSGGRHFITATPLTERVPELNFFSDGPEGAFLVLVLVRLAEMHRNALPSSRQDRATLWPVQDASDTRPRRRG